MKSEPNASRVPDTTTANSEETNAPAIEPCEHMKEYVSALSDDTLRGPARWYTQLHASYCTKCGTALKSLRHLRARLNRLRRENADREAALTQERHQAVQKAMEAADASQSS